MGDYGTEVMMFMSLAARLGRQIMENPLFDYRPDESIPYAAATIINMMARNRLPDNLLVSYPFGTAYVELLNKGLVKDGELTDKGRKAYLFIDD